MHDDGLDTTNRMQQVGSSLLDTIVNSALTAAEAWTRYDFLKEATIPEHVSKLCLDCMTF
jgi:hypothetical protein